MIIIRATLIDDANRDDSYRGATVDFPLEEISYMKHYTNLMKGDPRPRVLATWVVLNSGASINVHSLRGKLPDSVTIFNATK